MEFTRDYGAGADDMPGERPFTENYHTDEYAAGRTDDVYRRGAEAAELAGNTNTEQGADSLWAYYSEIGVFTENLERPTHLHIDQFPLAEEIDPDVLRAKAVILANPRSIMYRADAASSLIELALATPDKAEMEEAFAIAEALNRSITAEVSPQKEPWYRASLALDYMPILRMRRSGAAQGDMAELAHSALSKSLEHMAPETAPLAHQRLINQSTVGVFAEHAVAGLVARVGRVPFFSSAREGRGTSHGVSRASDFHLVEEGKIPVEVKYKKPGFSKTPYHKRIALVKYTEVCKAAGVQVYGAGSSVHEHNGALAVAVAHALAREGEGSHLADHERRLLDEASFATEAIINAKRAR